MPNGCQTAVQIPPVSSISHPNGLCFQTLCPNAHFVPVLELTILKTQLNICDQTGRGGPPRDHDPLRKSITVTNPGVLLLKKFKSVLPRRSRRVRFYPAGHGQSMGDISNNMQKSALWSGQCAQNVINHFGGGIRSVEELTRGRTQLPDWIKRSACFDAWWTDTIGSLNFKLSIPPEQKRFGKVAKMLRRQDSRVHHF